MKLMKALWITAVFLLVMSAVTNCADRGVAILDALDTPDQQTITTTEINCVGLVILYARCD